MVKDRKPNNLKGFTITETIVSLAVFGIITILIISAVSAIQSAQRNERYLDLANTTARQLIEEVRNGQYSALAASDTGISYDRTASVPSTLPQGFGTMVVSTSTDFPNYKRLDVTVGYKIGTYTRQVTHTAVIGSGGITP